MPVRPRCALSVAVLLAACIAACGETATEQVVAPDPVRCHVSVPSPPIVPAAGGSIPLPVNVPRDCTWSVSTEDAWVRVSPASGQGSAALTATVAANPQPQVRASAIVLNDARVRIEQEAAPCRFELGSQQARLGVDGGHARVQVSTSEACEWRASSPVSWAQVLTEHGIGAGTVNIDISRNDGPERAATLSIAGLGFNVSQEGASPPPPSPPPVVCTFAIDPEAATFASPGGAGSVRIITQPGCAWTASTGATWIFLGKQGGSGPEMLSYVVPVYTSYADDRSATVLVAGRTHLVRQQAYHPEEISREGYLSDVTGTCPNFTFAVGGRTFFTDGHTKIDGGCGEIANGVRAFVRGELLPDGRILATQVDIDD